MKMNRIGIISVLIIAYISYSCTGEQFSRSDNNKLSNATMMVSDSTDKAEVLRRLFEQGDYLNFVQKFPSTFDEFLSIYGFLNKKRGSNYEVSMEHIVFFFKNADLYSDRVLEKSLKIAVDGKWQADAVNHFQRGLLNFILSHPNKTLNHTSQLDSLTSFKLYYFLFDGPSPNDSSSSKKYKELSEILSESKREKANLELAYDSLLREW